MGRGGGGTVPAEGKAGGGGARNSGNRPSRAAPRQRCAELARLGVRSGANHRGPRESSLEPGLGAGVAGGGGGPSAASWFGARGSPGRRSEPGMPEKPAQRVVFCRGPSTGGGFLPIFIFVMQTN